MAEHLQLAADWATTLGILLGVVVFIVDRQRTRRERELDTYRDLSARYFEYLQILLANDDVSSTETEWGGRVNPGGTKQTLIVQMAVSMIEAAYFMYRGQRSSFRRAQWEGWYQYLKDWCAHSAFVAAWPEVIDQYDRDFQATVRAAYTEVQQDRGIVAGTSLSEIQTRESTEGVGE